MCAVTAQYNEELRHIEYAVEKYSRMLFRICYGVLDNRSDAEDAVQTALLRIARQGKKLPANEKALRAYVLTAAKHSALNQLSARSEYLDLDGIVVADQYDLFETIVSSQEYDRLLRAIKSLPPIYREVLMLRYVQQLETKEIAKLLDRPKNTVQKQILRAKTMLTKIYEILVER